MFKRGDIVKLRQGSTPMVVLDTCGSYVVTMYLTTSYLPVQREPQGYRPYKERLTKKHLEKLKRLQSEYNLPCIKPDGELNMTTLYETKDKRYGTKLATNSEGKIVLEIKGTGEVEAFDPKDITEVVPYTVTIEFFETKGYNYNSNRTFAFKSTKGAVAKGDIIIVEGRENMARVTAIDTKIKNATKVLKGRKVKTEKIK